MIKKPLRVGAAVFVSKNHLVDIYAMNFTIPMAILIAPYKKAIMHAKNNFNNLNTIPFLSNISVCLPIKFQLSDTAQA
jgi:hypothetical protein